MEAQLTMVEALLQDVENDENKGFFKGTVQLCIDQVQEVVWKIHSELDQINCEIETHKMRYFASYRSPSFSANIDELAKLQVILDRRFDLLIKMLAIPQRSPEQPRQPGGGGAQAIENGTPLPFAWPEAPSTVPGAGNNALPKTAIANSGR